MNRIWIKICANTNVEDARLASDHGADAVGFVFASSPRQVTAKQVAAIVSELPEHVEKIGVFSLQKAGEIIETVRYTGLTGVQLHGAFDMPLARRLNGEFGGTITIIQTLHWDLEEGTANADRIAPQLLILESEAAVHRVLIDSKTKQASGGTGLRFDWNAAAQILTADPVSPHKSLIVAGGLGPSNVADAVRAMEPWGVDVASGVENSPGRKDAQKVELFIRTLREFR